MARQSLRSCPERGAGVPALGAEATDAGRPPTFRLLAPAYGPRVPYAAVVMDAELSSPPGRGGSSSSPPKRLGVGDRAVGPEHQLLGMLRDGGVFPPEVLKPLRLDLAVPVEVFRQKSLNAWPWSLRARSGALRLD